MANYDGSIRINTEINTRGLRQGESDIRGSIERISGMARKMASIIAVVFVTGKIAEFGKECIEAASGFEAMESQFSQVFGDLEEKAGKSLQNIANQTGILEERMKGSYTKIAAFAKTTGMDTASSLELANRAMVAVADSAAFYDRSLEETTESLQSFLKGNYENDAALGLSVTETTRNAAANKLYGKSFIELSEAQKQLTLLQMVEDANRLSGALGQASREADTWTNQTGNLNQSWVNLKANLGKFVLPMAVKGVKLITNVINSINALLAKLYTAASAFRSFSEFLTGSKSASPSATGAGSSNGMGDMAAEYTEAAGAAEELSDSTEKVADATTDAKKAAEGYLSPLDEINKLGEKDSSSGSVSGDSGSVGAVENIDYGNLAEGETIIDETADSLGVVIEKIKELAGLFKEGFLEGFGDYKSRIEDLKSDLLSIGNTLKEIFTSPEVISAANEFSNQLAYSLGQITGSIASIGLTIAQNFVGGMEKYLTQNVVRIKDYIVNMFDISSEIASITGNLFSAIADIFSVFGGDTAQQITGNLIGIFAEVGMMVSENAAKLGRDILNMIARPIIENKDKIKEAIEGTLEAIEPFTSGLLTAVQTVRDAVTEIYDEHLKPLFDSIATGLSDVFGKLLDGYNTYMLPVLQGLGEKFKEIMEGPFGEAIEKVKGFIEKLIDALKLLWENVLVPLFSWIADNIMPVLSPIINFIGETVMTVIETIINIVGDIASALGGLIDFIVGIFTGDWERAWEGIKSFFSGIWDAITDFLGGIWEILKSLVSNGLDFIKSRINSVWEGIKLITSTVWNAIKTATSTVWNGIKTAISTVINGIKTGISNALNSIKSIWNKIWTGLKTTVTNIFNGIWNTIKGVINSILGGIEGMANGVIKGVNTVIGALNNLNFDVPDWIPGIGGNTFGFNIPELSQISIPRLATGTVIPPNKEFLAVLGDQKHGTNIEAPLDTIVDAVKIALQGMNFDNGNRNSGNNVYKISAGVKGRQILEIILDEARIKQAQNGKNPFVTI